MGGVRTYGLGMTRADAVSAFEALGYTFRSPASPTGRPRRPHAIGQMSGGQRRIELIGPEERIFKAVLIADLDDNERGAAAPFLRTIAPDWGEGPDWFAQQIAARAHLSGVATALPGLEVWLRAMGGRDQVVLTLNWVPRSGDNLTVAEAGGR
jgi:hypothetical protein